jgi:hypothetical protein
MPHPPAATPPRPRHAARRGSVIVAIIVALVMLQLVVVGVVMLGSREQNLTILRLEASKAQYAAEAGMNMALREVYDNADEDGDGVVGSISNDGNSGNDPTVNGASIVVSQSVSGAVTTITSTARTTNAKRSITVTLQ